MVSAPFKSIPLVLCTLALAAAGCRGVPPPVEQLAVTRTAIEDAMAAGAAEHAPAELTMAREKLERARALSQRKKNYEAARLAAQAELDARLAATKARNIRAQRANTEAQENVRKLQERLNVQPR